MNIKLNTARKHLVLTLEVLHTLTIKDVYILVLVYYNASGLPFNV